MGALRGRGVVGNGVADFRPMTSDLRLPALGLSGCNPLVLWCIFCATDLASLSASV
ncbi:MAG: hypothetical protein RI897_4346 [Verrucomicrobiota bacterium]